MTEDSKTHCLNKLIEAIREFDDDYLADVFRPWDCYSQNWHDVKVILFRFENNDLLVHVDNIGIYYEIGSVDTNDFKAAVNCSDTNEDCCLCWQRTSGYQDLVGTKSAGCNLLCRFLRDEFGDSVELCGNLLERYGQI